MYFREISIETETFSFKKIQLLSFGKWRHFCLGLNMLVKKGEKTDNRIDLANDRIRHCPRISHKQC